MSEPNFNTKTYIIPANGSYTVAAVGNFITNLTQTTVAGSLTLKIGDGRETRFDGSDTYLLQNGETFNEVTLKNTTGGNVTVKLGIGQGEIRVANAVTVSGAVATTEVIAATFTDVPDVSILTTATTLVAAAKATRKSATFSNLDANGTVVRIGTSAAAAARGNEIPIGGSAKVEHTAAVYIYNPSAATISIGVTETST